MAKKNIETKKVKEEVITSEVQEALNEETERIYNEIIEKVSADTEIHSDFKQVTPEDIISDETKKMVDDFNSEAKKIDKLIDGNVGESGYVNAMKDELERVESFENKLEEKIKDGESKLNDQQKDLLNKLTSKRSNFTQFWNGVSDGWFNM